jgi:hypothetical protein
MNCRHASVLRLAAVAILVALMGACGGGATPPSQAPAFYIVSSVPAFDALFVPLDQTIVLEFNKAIDPATIGLDSIRVTSGGPVTGTTFLDGAHERQVRWTPMGRLEGNRTHTCRLRADLRSVHGDAVGGPQSFDFRTTFEETPDFLPSPTQLRRALGSLNVGRQDHRATRLTDGRVLITGGFTQGATSTDRAEIFQAGTESFTELTEPMSFPRATHTATLLADGSVLLCGGWFEQSPGNPLVTFTAELFFPGTNSFVAVGDMTKARAGHAALRLPDGRVLITGGSRLDGNFLTDHDDAEIYDPTTRTFSPHPQKMLHTRSSHGMVDTGNGTFVLAGGSDQDLRIGRYDVVQAIFGDLGSAGGDQVRFGPAVAAFDSGAVAIAGGDLSGTVLHIYADGTVRNTGSGLNYARSYATASPIAPDMLLIVGGIDFSRGGFIEASCDLIKEDTEGGVTGSNTYGTDVRFPHGMAGHAATVLIGGDILYCGGVGLDGSQPNHADAFLFELAGP